MTGQKGNAISVVLKFLLRINEELLGLPGPKIYQVVKDFHSDLISLFQDVSMEKMFISCMNLCPDYINF